MVISFPKSCSLFLLGGIYPYRETKQEKTMQQRHLKRKQYFDELANTAREFYLDYLHPLVACGLSLPAFRICATSTLPLRGIYFVKLHDK